MYKKTVFLYMIFLLTCKTSTPRLEPPKNYEDVLQEVQKSTELKQNPKLQNKIINTIKEQNNYSNSCYSKIQELEERLNKLEAENEKLRKENEALRDELATWHKIQFGFWLIIAILIIALIVKLLAPIVKTLVRV